MNRALRLVLALVLAVAGASGPGFYYSATGRAPNPGEFTFLTQGMLRAAAQVGK